MPYVLDSTAVLALLLGEPEAVRVADLIEKVQAGEDELLMPFMTLMEVRYRLLRDFPSEASAAGAVVNSWPAHVEESNSRWREAAARVKARGGLSLADAWIAALALMHDAELVHKDPRIRHRRGSAFLSSVVTTHEQPALSCPAWT